MFRSVWSKTLRDYRIAIVGWGIGMGLILLAVFAAATPAVRTDYAQAVQSLRFFGDLVAITTPEGYATFRITGFFGPILLCIWPMLAGARMVRGEEERGSLDLLLATPQSHGRVLIEKILAFVLAMVLIGLMIGLGTIAGEASAKETVDVWRALGAGLQMSLIAFFFGALALLLSQVLTSRGAAAGWAGALMVLSFLLDGTGRMIDNGVWLQRFSPLYYYDLNKPLIPTYPANFGATALLLGLSIVFVIVSVLLFIGRDVGGTALAIRNRSVRKHTVSIVQTLERARSDVFGRTVGLRAFRAQVVPIFWWLLGLIVYGAWTTLLIPSFEELIKKILGSSPVFAKLFNGQDAGTNAGFLAIIVFAFLPAIAVIFTMVQALTWSSDLDNGRLELVLSTPRSRFRVVLERFGAVFVATLLAPLLVWLTVLLSARAINISLDAGNVAAASFGMLPLELIAVTLIFALAGRLRYGAVLGIICTYIALAFLVEFLRSLLNLPDWVVTFSIFHQYGSPVTDGWKWGPFFTMIGVAVVLLALGVFQFIKSDIERGA